MVLRRTLGAFWVAGSIMAVCLCAEVRSKSVSSAPSPGWLAKPPPDGVKLWCTHEHGLFYSGEPISFEVRGGRPGGFEVRDYWGMVVARGTVGLSIRIPPQPPGWYKLYIHRKPLEPNADVSLREYQQWYGDVVGTSTFVVFRQDRRFPHLGRDPGAARMPDDMPVRGVTGMGPSRLAVTDAGRPEQEIRWLEEQIALYKKYYLPYDPDRHRVLMVAFSKGTRGKLEGVRKIVEHFKAEVRYWEPRNEPNFGSSGKDFVANELRPFYETIKSVDPKLRVMGPGTVSIGPQLQPWLDDFFRAGGGKYIDVFSFHFYNGINGDLWLGRKSMDTLQNTLARYGLSDIEKWQTEQGYFCCTYGSYQPRHQGRWTMLQMMLFEQYSLPKEHNVLWYDKSHGFWDMPTWWENSDGSFNPAVPLMRVWAEELYGKQFARRFQFGPSAEQLYIGSLFTGKAGSVAAFQSAGSTDGKITLAVHGSDKLHLVSAFGVESDLPVKDGRAQLPVPELPVYVELPPGQTIDVVPQDWGEDLARGPGVRALASGIGRSPADPKNPNDISSLINGQLEDWYWLQQPWAHPWMDLTDRFPAWVELQFPESKRISRVVIYAAVPWQSAGTLLDYELQYDRDGKWVTIEHVSEPTKTYRLLSAPTRTKVDSFFSDRCIFQHEFQPIETRRIRLLVHDATCGGGATPDVVWSGGQSGPQHVNLREIEVYSR